MARYFCCPISEDYDAMASLIALWSDKKDESYLYFDVIESAEPDVYTGYKCGLSDFQPIQTIKVNKRLSLLEYNPQIEPTKKHLLSLWNTCLTLTKESQTKTIAWAFNVISLRKPLSFTLVQPGSLDSFQSLRSYTTSQAQLGDGTTSLAAIVSDFMSQGNVSFTNRSFLQQEIQQQYDSEEWEELFDNISLDFHEGIEQFRYYVLQAILIPERIVDLIEIVVNSIKDEGSLEEYKKIEKALNFLAEQEETSFLFEEGIWYLFNHLVEKENKLNPKFFQKSKLWQDQLNHSLDKILACYGQRAIPNWQQLDNYYGSELKQFIETIQTPVARKRRKNKYQEIINFFNVIKNKSQGTENKPKSWRYDCFEAFIRQNIFEKVPEKLVYKIDDVIKLIGENEKKTQLRNLRKSFKVQKSLWTVIKEVLGHINRVIKLVVTFIFTYILNDSSRQNARFILRDNGWFQIGSNILFWSASVLLIFVYPFIPIVDFIIEDFITNKDLLELTVKNLQWITLMIGSSMFIISIIIKVSRTLESLMWKLWTLNLLALLVFIFGGNFIAILLKNTINFNLNILNSLLCLVIIWIIETSILTLIKVSQNK